MAERTRELGIKIETETRLYITSLALMVGSCWYDHQKPLVDKK